MVNNKKSNRSRWEYLDTLLYLIVPIIFLIISAIEYGKMIQFPNGIEETCTCIADDHRMGFLNGLIMGIIGLSIVMIITAIKWYKYHQKQQLIDIDKYND